MLLHSPGGETLHLRNPDVENAFASLVILPPAVYRGGEITVRIPPDTPAGRPGEEVTYDLAQDNARDFAYFALFGCATYDVLPLLEAEPGGGGGGEGGAGDGGGGGGGGSRLMLVYNLVQKPERPPAVPRIRFRDEARIRRELVAALEKWECNTSMSGPIVWMMKHQYAKTTYNGKAITKSRFKAGVDRNVVELLQEAVRAGANVDWCVGTVQYTLSGEGERNPSWTCGQPEDKRWRECSKTTSHSATVSLGKNHSSMCSSVTFKGSAKDVVVCQSGFLEETPTNPIFEFERMRFHDPYDSSDSECSQTAITFTTRYPERSCLFIWPRSDTYTCLGTGVCNSKLVTSLPNTLSYVCATRMMAHLEKSTKSPGGRFSHSRYERHNAKFAESILRAQIDSFDCRNFSHSSLTLMVDQIVKYNVQYAAHALITNYAKKTNEHLQDHFWTTEFPKLMKIIDITKLSRELSFYHYAWGDKAEFVTRILAAPFGDDSETAIHPFREVLVDFSKDIKTVTPPRNSMWESSHWCAFGKSLGCSSYTLHPSHNKYDGWPKHSVSKIMVLMCKYYPPSTEPDLGPVKIFITALLKAYELNRAIDNLGHIKATYDIVDLERVGRTLAQTKAGCAMLSSLFIEDAGLSKAWEITFQLIRKKNGIAAEIPQTAIAHFAQPLLKGAGDAVISDFATLFMKNLNTGIEQDTPSVALEFLDTLETKNVKFDTLLCFLCDLKAKECPSASIESLFLNLGSIAEFLFSIDGGYPMGLDLMIRLLSSRCLSSLFARCGNDSLTKSILDWTEDLPLPLGPAAAIVVNIIELGEVSTFPGGDKDSITAQDASKIVALSKELMFRFVSRINGCKNDLRKLSDSFSSQRNRSDVDSSSCWPPGSVGTILRHFCQSADANEATTASSGDKNSCGISDFILVIFQAIALANEPAIKSENYRSIARRLLFTSDVVAAFGRIGVGNVEKLLEKFQGTVDLGVACDFLGHGSTKSSAGSLGMVVADALEQSAGQEDASRIGDQLLLSIVQKRINATVGEVQFNSLVASIVSHPSLSRNILMRLCQSVPNGASRAMPTDIVNFIRVVSEATTQNIFLRFHENTFFHEDFDAALKICGYDNIYQAMNPTLGAFITKSRLDEAIYVSHLLLREVKTDMYSQTVAMAKNFAKILVKAVGASDFTTLENKALCILMFWCSHFEGTNGKIWGPSLTDACPGPIKKIEFSNPLAASTKLVAEIFKFDVEKTSSLLAEADTLLSSSFVEDRPVAYVRVAALLHQIASRAVASTKAKVSSRTPRPTATWCMEHNLRHKACFGGWLHDCFGNEWYKADDFLRRPCAGKMKLTLNCIKSKHRIVTGNMDEYLAARFFQPGGRGRYKVEITKVRQVPLDAASTVPKCRCGLDSCGLKMYEKGMRTAGGIDQAFLDGLQESMDVFALRKTGKKPEPEVEIVEAPPKEEAEVVDLIE